MFPSRKRERQLREENTVLTDRLQTAIQRIRILEEQIDTLKRTTPRYVNIHGNSKKGFESSRINFDLSKQMQTEYDRQREYEQLVQMSREGLITAGEARSRMRDLTAPSEGILLETSEIRRVELDISIESKPSVKEPTEEEKLREKFRAELKSKDDSETSSTRRGWRG